MNNLHIFTDLAVGAVLFFSILFAYYRGLSRELFALVAWFGAALIAIHYFKGASDFARSYITVDIIADLVAGSCLFLGALILISLVTHFIAYQIQNSSFGPIDQSLGIFYGALRGGVIVCLAYFALLTAVPGKKYPDWLIKARSFPYIEKTTYGLMELALPHVRNTEMGVVIQESLNVRDGKSTRLSQPAEVTPEITPVEPVEEAAPIKDTKETAEPAKAKESQKAKDHKKEEPQEKKKVTHDKDADKPKHVEHKKAEPAKSSQGYASEAREELDKLMEETKQ